MSFELEKLCSLLVCIWFGDAARVFNYVYCK